MTSKKSLLCHFYETSEWSCSVCQIHFSENRRSGGVQNVALCKRHRYSQHTTCELVIHGVCVVAYS